MNNRYYESGFLASSDVQGLHAAVAHHQRNIARTEPLTTVMSEESRLALGELKEELRLRCRHCSLRYLDHDASEKCLFEATTFAPIEVV